MGIRLQRLSQREEGAGWYASQRGWEEKESAGGLVAYTVHMFGI